MLIKYKSVHGHLSLCRKCTTKKGVMNCGISLRGLDGVEWTLRIR